MNERKILRLDERGKCVAQKLVSRFDGSEVLNEVCPNPDFIRFNNPKEPNTTIDRMPTPPRALGRVEKARQ